MEQVRREKPDRIRASHRDERSFHGLRSIVRFDVTNGQDILISVDGANGQQGRVVLSWNLTNAVAFASKPVGAAVQPIAASEASTTSSVSRTFAGPNSTRLALQLQLIAGRARVSFGAAANTRVVLESSTNLIDWAPVYTNSPPGSPASFEFPMREAHTRFFRAVR